MVTQLHTNRYLNARSVFLEWFCANKLWSSNEGIKIYCEMIDDTLHRRQKWRSSLCVWIYEQRKLNHYKSNGNYKNIVAQRQGRRAKINDPKRNCGSDELIERHSHHHVWSADSNHNFVMSQEECAELSNKHQTDGGNWLVFDGAHHSIFTIHIYLCILSRCIHSSMMNFLN